jgi:hypothetical protein
MQDLTGYQFVKKLQITVYNFMKHNTFNEWVTQNKDFSDETDGLIESQLDQWVNKLMGLLQTSGIQGTRKTKLLEKVINSLQERI